MIWQLYSLHSSMTKFLLDSGDTAEYREITSLASEKGSDLWGATTNPSLIAKKLAGKKVSQKEAFSLQKEIVMEILTIVPGPVSAEVYADKNTTADQMIEQGRDIAVWDERIVVKLPTTLEGFKARTVLRSESIPINNTLVFSQEQIYAVCLHEKLVSSANSITPRQWPSFISPFLGRLDDKGLDGLSLIEQGIQLQDTFSPNQTWMLASSVRNTYHLKKIIDLHSDITTVPAKVYREWFALSDDQKAALTQPVPNLHPIPAWAPSEEIKKISSLSDFMQAIKTDNLPIKHELTEIGIEKFTTDWQAIIHG